MNRCIKCVSPDSYPGLSLDDNGCCNHCLDHENNYGNWESTKEERKKLLEQLIEKARKKSKYYDVMVPLSGGKDSTYVLYIAAKVYDLKVLCYNFDNGFQTNIAKKNIESAVNATGADLIVFRPDPAQLMRLYRHFYKHTGLFCPVCMRGIYAGEFSLMKAYDIPLNFGGTSRRTEEKVVPEIFQAGDITFFENVLKAHPFPEDIRIYRYERSLKEKLNRALFLLSKGKIHRGWSKISLPDYLDWNYDEIFEKISEIGWKSLPDRDEHVDCEVDPVVHYQRQLQIPDLSYNTLKYSAEIRAGQMSREEALKLVEAEMEIKEPKQLNNFLEKLDITRKEFDLYMENRYNLQHMQYQKERLLMRAFKSLIRR